MGETIVNYVTEVRKPGGAWFAWPDPANHARDEAAGRKLYDAVLASNITRHGSLDIQFVRRTAVITDEVLAASPAPPCGCCAGKAWPGHGRITACTECGHGQDSPEWQRVNGEDAYRAARVWIAGAFPGADVHELTDSEVRRGVHENYTGGFAQFLADEGRS